MKSDLNEIKRFQFYISTIKAKVREGHLTDVSVFQFYISTIKAMKSMILNFEKIDFNSTLVRLKLLARITLLG